MEDIIRKYNIIMGLSKFTSNKKIYKKSFKGFEKTMYFFYLKFPFIRFTEFPLHVQNMKLLSRLRIYDF